MNHLRLLVLLVTLLTGCGPGIRFQPGEIPTPGAADAEHVQASALFYQAMLAQGPVFHSQTAKSRVSRVVERLLHVTPSLGHWSVVLVDEPMFNAMTMPGNFIYVFRGMLEQTESDDELAAILAHEIGHRLALHEQKTAGEKFGTAMAALTAAAVAAAVAADEESTEEDVLEVFDSVHTVGQGFTTLRYSKDKEREADLIGMFLMADAGYNPEAAAQVWAGQAAREGSGITDFFDTHPLHEDRYATAMQLLPQARARYESARGKSRSASRPLVRKGPSPQQIFELDQAHKALSENDYQTAESIASSLVRRNPSLTMAHNVLGIVKIRQGNPREAHKVFGSALRIEPENPTLIYNSACTNALQGSSSEALKLLERSFTLDPQLVETAKEDTDLSSLSNDPRFEELISRNYPPRPPADVGGNTFSIN